jgi:hypothetical protein
MGYVSAASLKQSFEDLLQDSPVGELAHDVATVLDDIGLAAQVFQELETLLLAKFGLTDAAALRPYLTQDAAKAAQTAAEALAAAKGTL